MIHGFVDISYAELRKYLASAEKKQGVCEIMPDGRFNLYEGGLYFAYLVCSDEMGSECTGAGAEGCRNCLMTEEEWEERRKIFGC